MKTQPHTIDGRAQYIKCTFKSRLNQNQYFCSIQMVVVPPHGTCHYTQTQCRFCMIGKRIKSIEHEWVYGFCVSTCGRPCVYLLRYVCHYCTVMQSFHSFSARCQSPEIKLKFSFAKNGERLPRHKWRRDEVR